MISYYTAMVVLRPPTGSYITILYYSFIIEFMGFQGPGEVLTRILLTIGDQTPLLLITVGDHLYPTSAQVSTFILTSSPESP